MGSSVTRCQECGCWNWAGVEKCTECGGKVDPTLNEIWNYYYATDPGFRKMVAKNRERDKYCPKCNTLVDKEGWEKAADWSKDADYNCPNCGHNIIRIRHT